MMFAVVVHMCNNRTLIIVLIELLSASQTDSYIVPYCI